jgi:hypothetical protein
MKFVRIVKIVQKKLLDWRRSLGGYRMLETEKEIASVEAELKVLNSKLSYWLIKLEHLQTEKAQVVKIIRGLEERGLAAQERLKELSVNFPVNGS